LTIHDDGKLCFECKKIGLLRKAHRIMTSGGAVCDEHFRDKQGMPQLTIEAKGLILRWKQATAVMAATAEVQSVEVKAPLGTIAQLAKKFIDAGMSVEDAKEALVGQQYSRKQATDALNELGFTKVQIQPKEKTIVAKRIDEATQDEMRKDAAAGMSINAIAVKHSSSWPTVKNIVGNGHKAAKKNAPTKSTNGRVHLPLRILSPKAHAFLEKWNTEANEAFAALPLEKKAELLGTL
jgi:hypothetical protein